jgi:hypothetical protein
MAWPRLKRASLCARDARDSRGQRCLAESALLALCRRRRALNSFLCQGRLGLLAGSRAPELKRSLRWESSSAFPLKFQAEKRRKGCIASLPGLLRGTMSNSQPYEENQSDESTDVASRRRAPRRQVKGVVRLQISEQDLIGEADNLSKSGVLFFTEGDLKVELEIDCGGETIKKTGCVVRCERIHDSRRGWAVEFDA